MVERRRPMSQSDVYPSLQAELEELVKTEHARIDSQDEKEKEKSGQSKGAAGKASPAGPPSKQRSNSDPNKAC